MKDLVKTVWGRYLGVNTAEANLAKALATEIESLRNQLKEVLSVSKEPVAWMHREDPHYVISNMVKTGICSSGYTDYTIPLTRCDI